ncbi:hypothetical protein CRV02_01520 [Arcobacter sp. CECT 8989]|uniref:DUF4197 domain-containing protein n=1 Tax=Arcobacter sp. CECT 8989 TaxID=2044509 RepID=UPI00100BDE97|nr:DUF4197 domain-containing protein [Arcobacter sp. CECT 8989]RXK03897.1 hypothetical protein CRV02_01520 [Arcobacter sp. CECT 8989]
MNKKIILSSLVLCSTLSFAFDLNSFTKEIVNDITKTETKQDQTVASSLSQDTVSKGLKEALKVGVNYATKTLGAQNGYLNNADVKIPLPENLQKAETLIRSAGGDKIADDLIKSMNNAATNAAPETAKIFIDAIEKMNLEDAKKILAGDEHSATNYFKENTNEALKKLIKPIVNKTMQENSVSKYYDTFNTYYKQYGKEYVENSSVMNLAKNFGVDEYIPSSSDESLDDYVTNKAINGLFKMISEKEASIRENPVEQTTSILKKVFGN